MRFSERQLEDLPTWNVAAVLAYVIGAVAAVMNMNNIVFNAETTVPALLGLIVSMIAYLVLYYLAVAAGLHPDQARHPSIDGAGG